MPDKKSFSTQDVLKDRANHISATIKANRERIASLREIYRDLDLRYWKDPHPNRRDHLKEILEEITALLKEQDGLLADQDKLIDSMRDELKGTYDRIKDALARTYDFQKHITTLSTASIVGIAAFVRLFDSSPEFRPAVTIALVCFVVTIVLSVFSMLGDLIEMMTVESPNKKTRSAHVLQHVMFVFRVVSLTAFCMGLITVAVFAAVGI